ncbi:MAG: efflux RND transporter periplasmic adaptor subunit [Candidatus Limimorpha sp.]
MRKHLIISIITLGLISCANGQSDKHEHEHAGTCEHEHEHIVIEEEHNHDEEEVASNMVSFTHEQASKVDFEVMTVEMRNVDNIIKTTAQIIPAQYDTRIITASTDGVVEFTKANIVAGTEVSQGQHLFSISNSNMNENNLAVRQEEFSAEYKRAKAAYERKKVLYDDKLVSEEDMQLAEAEYLKAKKAYENMQENFADGKQVAKSPVNGYVKELLVENGTYVTAGQMIMTVIRNEDLYLEANLQPRYYTVLKDIVSADIRVMGSDKVYSIEQLGGRLLSYSRTTSLSNPLISVLFEIKNNGELLVGSFVELFIKTSSDKQGIMVPNTAIVEEMGSHFVFVQEKPELYEKRAVSLGMTDSSNTLITKGLKAGEKIVSRGAIYVKLVQGSGKLDPHAGHVH